MESIKFNKSKNSNRICVQQSLHLIFITNVNVLYENLIKSYNSMKVIKQIPCCEICVDGELGRTGERSRLKLRSSYRISLAFWRMMNAAYSHKREIARQANISRSEQRLSTIVMASQVYTLWQCIRKTSVRVQFYIVLGYKNS